MDIGSLMKNIGNEKPMIESLSTLFKNKQGMVCRMVFVRNDCSDELIQNMIDEGVKLLNEAQNGIETVFRCKINSQAEAIARATMSFINTQLLVDLKANKFFVGLIVSFKVIIDKYEPCCEDVISHPSNEYTFYLTVQSVYGKVPYEKLAMDNTKLPNNLDSLLLMDNEINLIDVRIIHRPSTDTNYEEE